MAKETLASMLDDFINEQLDQIVLSNPAEKDHLLKVKVRPMLMKGALVFQAEEFTRTQAFHKNMSAEELKVYLTDQLSGSFRMPFFSCVEMQRHSPAESSDAVNSS